MAISSLQVTPPFSRLSIAMHWLMLALLAAVRRAGGVGDFPLAGLDGLSGVVARGQGERQQGDGDCSSRHSSPPDKRRTSAEGD